MKEEWEFYKDMKGKWRWKKLNKNGKVVKRSSINYINKLDCLNNARKNGYLW